MMNQAFPELLGMDVARSLTYLRLWHGVGDDHHIDVLFNLLNIFVVKEIYRRHCWESIGVEFLLTLDWIQPTKKLQVAFAWRFCLWWWLRKMYWFGLELLAVLGALFVWFGLVAMKRIFFLEMKAMSLWELESTDGFYSVVVPLQFLHFKLCCSRTTSGFSLAKMYINEACIEFFLLWANFDIWSCIWCWITETLATLEHWLCDFGIGTKEAWYFDIELDGSLWIWWIFWKSRSDSGFRGLSARIWTGSCWDGSSEGMTSSHS